MATSTTRLALVKPSGSASPEEPVDVTVINDNMDDIDRFIGCILVNDGVTPATGDLFDGAIVKERTSGKIWEARLNGGGTFDKVWIRYPYHFKCDSGQDATASGSDHTSSLDTSTFSSTHAKNSSTSDISSGEWVAPIKGIYLVSLHVGFEANSTGFRVLKYKLDGAIQSDDWAEVSTMGNTSTNTRLDNNFTRQLTAGQTIVPVVYQNSGVSLISRAYMTVALIEPTQ